MVATFEQLRTKNLKTFDELRTAPERPDFGMIAIPRKELPGVWNYDKQLDALLGDPQKPLEDFAPLDVRFDIGRIVGMTEKPDKTKAKMENSLYYSIIFNTAPSTFFNLLDELNKIAFKKPIDVENAVKEYSDYYTGAKSYVGAIKHGLRRANAMAEKQIGGLAKMVGEFITPQERVRPLFPALNAWEKANADILTKWGDMILADVEDYYRENKAEAIQILPDIGYWETLKQYITKPTNLVQGIVESVPLMLEGILGVTLGGPAGGIALMSVPISGDVYADARAEGTEPLPAMAQAILTGTGEATIEQWTLSRKLGLMKNFRKIVADGLPKVLWEGTKAFFRGTAEEGTQEFNRNFWKWLFTDRSQQWTENVAESMAAGGPIEMVMAGAFSAAGAVGPTIAKEQQVMRLDKIEEAVRAEPTLTEEHKAEIQKELDTVREQVEQDQFPETPAIVGVQAPQPPIQTVSPAKVAEIPQIPAKAEPEAVGVEGLAETEERGKEFKTGKAITFEYIRNIQKAPDMGKRFQQNIEPAGRFMQTKPRTFKPMANMESGEVTFENPLVIEFNTGTEKTAYDENNWKARLSKAFDNKTGAELSKAIIDAGYDGIITIGQHGETSEIVDLTQPPTPAKPEVAKPKKPVEKPLQKLIKVEKKIIPKVSTEKFTPPEVQKETRAEVPDSDSETQNAANLLEGYWREHDERKLEIDVAATKNQEAVAKALDKKRYLPESDIETSKMSQAMMLYIDLKEHPSGHQFAEEISKQQKEIYELSKDLPANIQRIADSIIQQNREFGALAIDKEIISVARENYIAHIWERPTRQESLQARFRQTTARAKARTLEGGIMEGWAKGKTLRVKDVTLATQIAQSQINQAIVGREMLKLGKKWGLLSHKQPADWVRVEHPGFTTWRWAGKAEKAKTYGRNFFVTEEGDLMERVPVYAEPELGKKLNKVFTPSALYKVPGIETISRYNAQIKTTILFTSLYHHQAFLRSYAFGSRGLNPKAAYEKGRQAIMNMTPEVRLLVRNGLTIGRIQDYDPRMIEGEQTIWGRALSHTKLTESIREKLVALRKSQERFLFNRLGPALKIQAGILELKAELKRNQAELESGEITADEIAAAVANLINNDFGGLHLGRMGRSQTAQHIFRLLALAPDWTESNIRSAVDAFRKGETGYLHRMFWGRIAVKGLGATILFNLLLSAFDDDDFAERYKKAWETGRLRWLDIDITPIHQALGGDDDKRKYFSLLGHFRDPVKFTAHPFISAKHKGSVVSRVMLDMMIGQDWAGRQFTTIGELTGITEDGKNSGRLVRYARGGAKPIEPAQVPSYALYQVRSAMPIPMQNLIAFLGGEMDAFDAITKSAGLMTATTYPERKSGRKRIKRSE